MRRRQPTGVALAAWAMVASPSLAAQTPTPENTTQAPQVQAEGASRLASEAKITFVNPVYIARNSAEGKAATARIEELSKKKATAIEAETKRAEELRQQLAQDGSVLSEQSRMRLERRIGRAQLDLERFREDAQWEVQALQFEIERQLSLRITEVIRRIGAEKGLLMVFDARAASFLLWRSSGFDISDEVVKRLDATFRPPAPNPAGSDQPRH